MFSHEKPFGSARIAAVLSLGLISLLACRDSATSTPVTRPMGSGAVKTLQGATVPGSRDRQRIHDRNKEDWVGVSHNRALDDFRRELRKPGVLTTNVCDFVFEFSVHQEQPLAQKRIDDGAKWHAARAALDASDLCGRRRSRSASNAAFSSPLEPLAPRLRQSPEGEALFGDIATAVDQSANSFELASRLNTVLDRAEVLEPSDQVIIASTVSVAQNSFEYWESQSAMFEREIIDEYGACALEQSSAGATAETVRNNCLGGQSGDKPLAIGRPDLDRLRVAGVRRSMFCGPSLSAGFRKVAGADASGGFKGAVAGFFAAGLEGAVGGAIVGAIAGSSWAAIENAWETLRCMYQF